MTPIEGMLAACTLILVMAMYFMLSNLNARAHIRHLELMEQLRRLEYAIRPK